MADVFLSYKRSERSQIERIATSLRELGLTVWFDASMSAGDTFNDEIDREARMARVVLVCWSPDARESEWVKAEAMIGFTQKKLAACYVAGPDNFDPPTPFNTRHAEDLRGWFAAPSPVHSSWKSVLRSIGRLCERADLESYGALDTQATAADLRTWINTHDQSPLFVTVDALLRERDVEEAERNRVEHAAREQRAREEAEHRAREDAERAAREAEERRRPKPAPLVEPEPDTERGQPSGFLTLLLTEAFERFAYYGARSILILYLISGLALADSQASTIYGVFTSLLYLLPILGAIIADRVIGSRRSVATGSLLLVAGYAALAVSASNNGLAGADLTNAALALVAVGSAFVKPSLLSSLGALYGENDPRRDGGFTILYVGVNLGAFAAGLGCAYVAQLYGWGAGFALAGAGMLAGLAIYLLGQGALKQRIPEPPASIGGQFLVWGVAVATAAAAFLVLRHADVAEQFMGLALIAGCATALLYVLASFGGQERSRSILAFLLIASVAAFFMLFDLAGSATYLFAERNVDLSSLPGVTASQTVQVLPAIVTLLLGLPLAFFWIALARSRLDPSAGIKFAFGLVLVAAGFLVVTFAAQFADQDARVPFAWLITLFLLQGLGELLVVPIGMSAMTKLAPARATNLMMAMWFTGSALALPLAQQITASTSSETVAGQMLDPTAMLALNVDVFTRVGLIGLGVAAVLLLLWLLLSRFVRPAR